MGGGSLWYRRVELGESWVGWWGQDGLINWADCGIQGQKLSDLRAGGACRKCRFLGPPPEVLCL